MRGGYGRFITLTLALGVVALLLAPPSGAATPSRRAPCSEKSWTGGVTEWCDGTFVYRDYVYDDGGADTAPNSGQEAWDTRGDVDHTSHGQSQNSADLIALQLSREQDALVVRIELNTLFPSDGTIAAVAIDTDDDGRTGGGPWGDIQVRSTGWDVITVLTDRDAAKNTIEGRLRLASWEGPVRLQAVVALGDGTPMNVAFRPQESGSWWEDAQATALTSGDVSPFAARIDLRDFGSRHTPAGRPRPGYHERIYRSDIELGEGITDEIRATFEKALFHFLGRHQPYALYVPRSRPAYGAQLLLHGLSATHGSVAGQAGVHEVLGDRADRIIVSPLGRGPSNYWVDSGARDALDALDDAMSVMPIDEDRVIASGYSMGGGGAMYLSALFPDRFATTIAWVPFTGNCLQGTPLAQGRERPDALGAVMSNDAADRTGCPLGTRGNQFDYLDNLRHVPSAFLFGFADELIWPNHHVAVAQRMQKLGYEHRVWDHTAEHFTLAITDDWQKEAAFASGRRVVRRPARVTYRTNVYLYRPKFGIVPDGAYWVDELTPRSASTTPSGDMVVDLTSHACRSGFEVRTTEVAQSGADPVPWVGTGRDPVRPVPVVRGARLSGELTNVKSILIDVAGACLAPGAPIALDVRTDGATVMRFSDGRPPVKL